MVVSRISYQISAIKKNRLGDCCAITSCFGILAFKVKGKTLHSKFQPPIRGKKNHDLKGEALVHLQELSSIKFQLWAKKCLGVSVFWRDISVVVW